MSKEEIFEVLCEQGCFCAFSSGESEILLKLEKDGLCLRCSTIEHSPRMLNPDYTFVSNDERGRELALKPLFTR